MCLSVRAYLMQIMVLDSEREYIMSEYHQTEEELSCRLGCGACCIAPSISSAIPGMPEGKPAGIKCVQLDENNLCKIFEDPARPDVCSEFKAAIDICGINNRQALEVLNQLEVITL